REEDRTVVPCLPTNNPLQRNLGLSYAFPPAICVSRDYNGSKRRNRKLSLMSFLTLKALKAGYTRLTHPGGAREPFNSKLPGNYTSVTVLSRAKAQTWGLIAAISYFNLGSRKCICHSLVAQRLLVSETAITRRNYSATLNSATATSRVD
ncbi:hypothetical protein ALC56_07301, partial [Trachymyrmex septentrionalis]